MDPISICWLVFITWTVCISHVKPGLCKVCHELDHKPRQRKRMDKWEWQRSFLINSKNRHILLKGSLDFKILSICIPYLKCKILSRSVIELAGTTLVRKFGWPDWIFSSGWSFHNRYLLFWLSIHDARQVCKNIAFDL